MYDVCEALFLHVFPAHSRCNPVDESWWTCLFKQGCQASAYTANIWSSCCTSWRERYIHTQWSFCCVSVIKRCTMGSTKRCCSQQTSCLVYKLPQNTRMSSEGILDITLLLNYCGFQEPIIIERRLFTCC